MLVCYFQKFTPLCLLFFSPARLLFFGFCPFCSFIRFSIKRQMELPNCEQDLLLNGKGYISSQIMQSANSEPKLSLIVLLFNVWFKKIGSKHNSNTLLSLLRIFMKQTLIAIYKQIMTWSENWRISNVDGSQKVTNP